MKSLISLSLPLIASTAFGTVIPKAPQSPIPSASNNAGISLANTADTAKVSVKPATKAEQTSSPKSLALGAITTDVEGDMTLVTARLNRSPEWKELSIEEHGTFLQIKLPKTVIPASGEFIDGNGPFLRKIATFQVGEEDGALRFFLNQDASKAKLATTAELLGDRIVIAIDHKKLEQLITPVASMKPETAPVGDTRSKAGEDMSLAAPSEVLSTAPAAKKTAQKSDAPGVELNSQLMKVATFCAGLFILLLGAQIFRIKNRNRKNVSRSVDSFEPATMKILSSVSIGQKQKLTLVQIGNQQILLGVGPESINLLTTIDDKKKSASFSGHLEQARPSAEVRLKSPDEIPMPRKNPKQITTTSSANSSRVESPIRGARINVGVGDEGAHEVTQPLGKRNDDITKLLRDRLRNLPPG